MKVKISTLQDAEQYVFTFDWYASQSRNQVEVFNELKICEEFGLLNSKKSLLCLSRAYLQSYYNHINELDAALELGEKNLQYAIAEELKDELLKVNSFLAETYQMLGDIAGSEKCITIFLERLNDIQDIKRISKIYDFIAQQYYLNSNIEKCIEMYEISIQNALLTDDATFKTSIFNNYGTHLLYMQEWNKANTVLAKGFNFLNQTDNKFLHAVMYKNRATLFVKLQEFDEAKSYFEQAIQYYKELNLVKELNEVMVAYADLLIQQNQLDEAKSILSSLLKNKSVLKSQALAIEIFQSLHQLYNHKRHYKKAYHYLSKVLDYKEINYKDHLADRLRKIQIVNEIKLANTQRENAEKIAKIKHDFLATMSHEIRTPINGILGVCYLIRNEHLSEVQANYINRMNTSAENLLHIVNDVLDISKIEAGKIELVPEPTSLESILENVHSILEAKAQIKGIQLQIKCDKNIPELLLDKLRIEQILLNLCNNAIKFTHDGEVRITCSYSTSSKANSLLLKVKDTGIGIQQDKLNMIFEEYNQETSTTSKSYGGTGLGLFICKKLTELMNGTISVSSQAGVGTEFVVKIPATIPEVEMLQDNAELDFRPEFLAGKSIFITDDNEENRLVLKEILLSLNLNIKISMTNNGEDLLELLKTLQPDGLFLDLDLPDINGFEVLQNIRKQKMNFTCIAYTASILSISNQELTDMGFEAILRKPFKINELKACLQLLAHVQ